MSAVLWSNGAVILALMTGLWILSLVYRNAGIIDAFWGPGFAIVAWNTWRQSTSTDVTGYLIPILVSVWGLRLGLHLAVRNHGKPEDFRYASMREAHGASFGIRSYFTVFLLQGVLMWFIALPIQLAGANLVLPQLVLVAGSGIWLGGFLIETSADWQLARFRSNPANNGKVLCTGVWRYTRHPNYFGDFCVWWGIWVICLSLGAPGWSVASPTVMSILLLCVSGVTLLEKTLVKSKPGYDEYVRNTSSFFPMWPRREKNKKIREVN